MTKTTLAMALLSILILGACTSGSGDKKANGVEPVSGHDHKVEACPQINGEFVQTDEAGREYLAKMQTTASLGGITLDASEVIWTIDGGKYEFKGDGGYSYIGVCKGGAVFVNLLTEEKFVGVMSWSLNEKGELVHDAQFKENPEENYRDVYQRKK